MLSLFSVFDPVTFYYSLNWLSVGLLLLMFPQLYWLNFSNYIYMMIFLLNLLFNEFKLIMKEKFNMNDIIFMMSLFLYIMYNNFMGLFPYIFTCTSHLVFSVLFSMSMWLSLMFFGWMKNTNFMFTHLVPYGTPFSLMFFMVLIELVSNLIRPLTLSIRLVANMIAGHLLLTLLGNFMVKLMNIYFLMLIFQIMLLILEFMVSIILSYVFVILMILYLKDTN
uniref:ATP synthase subunit a n=1 Tax=Phanerotoma flava TaxID=684660 RepID=D8WHA6_9HYME|nr:ATP synthase F0 subunit 6 [Phanerotoma flava]